MITWLANKLDKFIVEVKQNIVSWAKRIKEKRYPKKSEYSIMPRERYVGVAGYVGNGGHSGTTLVPSVSAMHGNDIYVPTSSNFKCDLCEKHFVKTWEKKWRSKTLCIKCFDIMNQFVEQNKSK